LLSATARHLIIFENPLEVFSDGCSCHLAAETGESPDVLSREMLRTYARASSCISLGQTTPNDESDCQNHRHQRDLPETGIHSRHLSSARN